MSCRPSQLGGLAADFSNGRQKVKDLGHWDPQDRRRGNADASMLWHSGDSTGFGASGAINGGKPAFLSEDEPTPVLPAIASPHGLRQPTVARLAAALGNSWIEQDIPGATSLVDVGSGDSSRAAGQVYVPARGRNKPPRRFAMNW